MAAIVSSLTGPPSRTRIAQPLLPWLVSTSVGCGGALALFPWLVMGGTAAYWDFPQGVIGSSWADMSAALSGYDSFVRESWQWPLFHVWALGGEAGANVIYTDSTPLVSLMGRLLFRLTGRVVPLFGAWAGCCLLGMALASTFLVRALGALSLYAAFASAVIGVSMPPLLARWGHLSLMGQWIIPLSLGAYVILHHRRQLTVLPAFGVTTGLAVIALLIHPYLFLMVTGVMATVPLQAVLTRRMGLMPALGVLGGMGAVLGAAMAAMGYLSSDGLAPSGGFGSFSTNLLSAFIPQMSGILPFGPTVIMQGTWGQFEGFAYLGLGVLMLIWFSRRSVLRWSMVLGHPWLLAVLAGFTIFAVSNEVYAAQFHLFTIPLPDGLLRMAGVLRASGRFVWVPLYLITGLAVAAASRLPRAGLLLSIAAGVQWVDAGPWRTLIRESVSHSATSALDTAAWAGAVDAVDRVVVDPPWLCTPEKANYLWVFRASIQIQLMASKAGRSTNTVYAARGRPDCAIPPLEQHQLLVRMHVPPVETPPSEHCQSSPDITACSLSLSPDTLRRLTRADTSLGW